MYYQKLKKKILIAAHHFSDAPNVYGKFIFSDFYDWIDFLGKKVRIQILNGTLNFILWNLTPIKKRQIIF